MIAMLILTPLSLMIAILRYEFIDIRLFYKRSVVYGIVLTFLALIYIGIIYLFSLFVHQEFENMVGIPNAIAAFVNILLFNFIRNKVQKFVDRKFFKVSYDFREVQTSFLKELKACYSSLSVYQLINRTFEEILPLENIDYMLYSKEEDDLWLVNKSDSFVDQNYLYQIKEICKTNLSKLPVAGSKSVDSDVEYKLNNSIFEHSPHSLFVMSFSEEGNLVNVLAVGRKKSGHKFRYEDISLLQLITTESGNTIQRLELQRNLLFQKEETKKLEELNEMKSFFVSSVSHELKTPMTSIKLFAELIGNNPNLDIQQRNEYLDIIQSECDRLNRLISNVLDFAKIERGTKEYRFELIDLNDIVRSIIKIMKYRIDFLGFELTEDISDQVLTFSADKDAISEVIMNLISNSLKYSKDEKAIAIKTFSKNGSAFFEITDKGIGISPEDSKKIFDAFYRSRSKHANQAGGTGIGLSIVKHIMEVHNGTIELRSQLGSGSKFTLKFPME
jgi:signal transduction histidine kinase